MPRDITFPESLHFSLVTPSSVGYGDIQPHTGFSRLITAAEILLGILLLPFGFSAIISHRNDRRGDQAGDAHSAGIQGGGDLFHCRNHPSRIGAPAPHRVRHDGGLKWQIQRPAPSPG
ncbi:potassium channel family protein [Skermanella sp. TT6]|uniref:potassium channel family protein n=1 Tax=Skermanella cutis TaxID=2775420 RepID=UPI001FFFBA06|nr:potassium channel family protein [Skermanella sp. TT6]